MRVLLYATALFAANVVVEAGSSRLTTIHPNTTASHSDAVSSIESTATSASVTVVETVSLSTTETTSAETTETTAPGTTLATTTSAEVLSTSVTEAPTTTTTGETSTTISSSTAPYFTPGSIVGTGPVAGLTLQGDGQRFIPLSFQQSGTTQTLIFSLANGKLATGTNKNSLCLAYKDQGVLAPLVLCPFDDFENAPLSCQQSSDGTLAVLLVDIAMRQGHAQDLTMPFDCLNSMSMKPRKASSALHLETSLATLHSTWYWLNKDLRMEVNSTETRLLGSGRLYPFDQLCSVSCNLHCHDESVELAIIIILEGLSYARE
ncbi:hypothetical protein SNK04_000114 [Fusarium graminearum]